MLVFRFLIDFAAAFAAWLTIYHTTDGSMLAGAGGAIAVALYGLWCFYDGLHSPRASHRH